MLYPPEVRRLAEKWQGIVRAIAGLSKDRSTKVGAVVFGPEWETRSTGYNGFPRGVDDNIEARHERPAKYKWTVHAEANAIAAAARSGVSLKNCTLVVTALHPCAQCAALIIQAGISSVVCPPQTVSASWAEEAEIARTMFAEAGVSVYYLDPAPSEGA